MIKILILLQKLLEDFLLILLLLGLRSHCFMEFVMLLKILQEFPV